MMQRIVSAARAPLVAGMLLVAALVATASPAAGSQWTCSASTAITTVAGKTPVNPVTATRTPCANQDVGLPKLTDSLGLAPGVTAKTAYAITGAEPLGAPPIAQTAAAAAGVEALALTTSDGTVVIGVDAARSAASASCVNGVPVLGGTSQVTNLTINGQSASLDDPLVQITDGVSGSPLGQVASIKLNEQIKTATGLVQNAAHIKILQAAGADPLADIVIAQSAVSSAGACDASAGENPPGTGGSGGEGFPPVCPPGSILDLQRALCIIPAAQTDGQGEIVVGRPYQGPSGGHVIALNVARKRYKSPCLSGSGPKYVVIGTNRHDHITGTNHGDRILGLGGSDSLDGGRGRGGLHGGRGRDAGGGGGGPARAV